MKWKQTAQSNRIFFYEIKEMEFMKLAPPPPPNALYFFIL